MTNFYPFPVRMDPIWDTKSFEQITSISSSTGLTAAKYGAAGVVFAFIQVTTSDCRYRTDGTAPTSSVGHVLATNGSIEVWGQTDMANFRAINMTGTSKLEVTYFGIGG